MDSTSQALFAYLMIQGIYIVIYWLLCEIYGERHKISEDINDNKEILRRADEFCKLWNDSLISADEAIDRLNMMTMDK